MGVSFDFKMQYPNWEQRLSGARQEIRLFVAAQMQFNRGMLFAKSGAYNGHAPWKPLVLRHGQPLKDRGTLSQSMAPKMTKGSDKPVRGKDGIVRFSGDKVTIGTKLKYAAMMNWGTTGLPGGVLRPKNAKALRFPDGKRGFIFAKSVRIPARRFDEWSPQDSAELSANLARKIKQVITR